MDPKYIPVIGLEIHVQLNTKTKLFCPCPNKSLGKPNTRVCPVCMGLPGTLPVPNKAALKLAAHFGKAINSKINNTIQFERKNYFYPDLPKGYQTSQFISPICEGGEFSFYSNGLKKTININRAHLEEDAGKLVHFKEKKFTGIDLNRCGVPLLEIVTEPVLTSPKEARIFLSELKRMLIFIGISECNMDKGQLRVDANISIRKPCDEKLNTRTEIKNLNSFKFVEKALIQEYYRQVKLKQNNEPLIQCTLNYNEKSDSVSIIRLKENENDYRYFPDPDQYPATIKNNDNNLVITEIPFDRTTRYMTKFKLSFQEANRLCQTKEISDFFEKCLQKLKEPKLLYNWITGDLSKNLNKAEKSFTDISEKATDFCDLLHLIHKGNITGKIGKQALSLIIIEKQNLKDILKNDLFQKQTDINSLKDILIKVFNENPLEVKRFKRGEQKLRSFFIGKVMRITNGKANPQILNSLLNDYQASAD